MHKDDIIRMARETLKEDDGECYYAYAHQIIHWWGKEDAIVKFAELIAAAEREACAKVCDELVLEHPGRADLTAIQCANAIRARGQ